MTSTRAGTAANISNDVKEALPTISRSLTDIARINPMFVGQGSGAGDQAQVDFGRGHELSLQHAADRRRDQQRPVRAGGIGGRAGRRHRDAADQPRRDPARCSSSSRRMTCGRAGSRAAASTPSPRAARTTFHGTAFFFGRNQDWVGKGVDRHEDLDLQGQAGRLQRRRADREGQGVLLHDARRPAQAAADGLLGRRHGIERSARTRRSIGSSRTCRTCITTSRGRIRRASSSRTTNSNKFFVRADFNLATGHQLTVRHNYVDGLTRHRHAVDDGVPYAGCVLPVQQHDELDGRPAELDVRHGRQRAARGLHARARSPRRAAVRAESVPAGDRHSCPAARRSSPAARRSRRRTSSTRTSSN